MIRVIPVLFVMSLFVPVAQARFFCMIIPAEFRPVFCQIRAPQKRPAERPEPSGINGATYGRFGIPGYARKGYERRYQRAAPGACTFCGRRDPLQK